MVELRKYLRNKLLTELSELLIFAPIDLAGREADQLHVASDSGEPSRLSGQL